MGRFRLRKIPELSGIPTTASYPYVSKQIRILNAPHGNGYTSARNAAKYVARGTAKWDGKSIRLIETDYRFNPDDAPPKMAVVHAPKLPEVLALPWEACWLNSEAAVIRFHGDQQSPYGVLRQSGAAA